MDTVDIMTGVQIVRDINDKIKGRKEMLEDSLMSDYAYQNAKHALETAKDNFNPIKGALLNEPENAKLVEEIKELQQEAKDAKADLSDNLLQYFAAEDSLTITDDDGQDHEITFNGRVK